MNQKGFSAILVILIVLGVSALGAGGYVYYKKSVAKPEQTNTQENTEQKQEEKLNEEGIIRKFFTLIDEGDTDGAVGMMSSKMAPNDNTKNTWKQSLAGFESVKVTKIEKSDLDQNDQTYVYKVGLNVQLKSDNGLMNWSNGEDIRFVAVVKNSEDIWQIEEIATGP